jgi:hypothetical protein
MASYIVGGQVTGLWIFGLSVFSFFRIWDVTSAVSHSDIWSSSITLWNSVTRHFFVTVSCLSQKFAIWFLPIAFHFIIVLSAIVISLSGIIIIIIVISVRSNFLSVVNWPLQTRGGTCLYCTAAVPAVHHSCSVYQCALWPSIALRVCFLIFHIWPCNQRGVLSFHSLLCTFFCSIEIFTSEDSDYHQSAKKVVF